jgi:hypothetical protein
MLQQRLACSRAGSAEERPANKTAQDKNKNRTSLRSGYARDRPEYERQNTRSEKRLEDHPGDSKRSLTVAQFDVPDRERGQESTKVPAFRKIRSLEPGGWPYTKMVGARILEKQNWLQMSQVFSVSAH